MKTAQTRWSAAARALHWIAAAWIFGQFAFGLWMVRGVGDAARKFDLYQAHKTSGVLLALLMAARHVRRLAFGRPPPPSDAGPARRRAAAAMHGALYALAFATMAAGYANVSTSPIPLPAKLPGGFAVPNLLAPDYPASLRWAAIHFALAAALVAMALAHAGAALWGHFAEGNDVLSRMLFTGRAAGARDERARDR